jgi:steroid delta-isomerase-like uncharacterized protein
MASKNVATALAVYDAFNARDLDKAVSTTLENVPWEDHGRGVTTKTRAELKASFKDWADGFSDGKITDTKAIDAGDTVIVEYIGRGTNDGPMGPAPATGKRVSLPFVDIVHFNKDGKISGGASYYDMFSLLVQMGLAEAMPNK